MDLGLGPELEERLLAGDPKAQAAFFHRYYGEVRAFVLRCLARGSNEQDSDEIVNDTFLRAFRSLEAFRGASSVHTWLLRLARNAAVDYYRSKRGHREHHGGNPHAPGTSSRSSPDQTEAQSSPLGGILSKERSSRVRAHLSQLTDDHREVIFLRGLRGRSIQQTAEVMERTPAAVKMLFVRALEKLAERLNSDSYFSQPSRKEWEGRDDEQR